MPPFESRHDELWREAGALAADDSGLADCEAIAAAAADHVSWHDASLCLVASRNLLSPRARAMMASGLMERVAGGGRVENARILASVLDAGGFKVVGRERGLSRSHVVVLDLEGTMAPAEAVKRLEAAAHDGVARPSGSVRPRRGRLPRRRMRE